MANIDKKPDTLVGWLRERAAKQGDRRNARYVFQDRAEVTLTFAQLERRSRQYASMYQKAGVKKGDVVAILLEHSEDLMPSFHGAQWLGAIPAFLQYPTSRLNLQRYISDLSLLLERSRPRAIVMFANLRDALAGKLPPGAALLTPDDLIDSDLGDNELAGDPAPLVPEDVCCIQYSSGSTGLQKGAALSHRAVMNETRAVANYFHFDANTRFVTWLPLYHDWGLFLVALESVMLGCEYTLMAPHHWMGKPASILHEITKDRATCYWLPNFAFNYMAQRVKDEELAGVDLSSLTVVSNGAEPCFYESHEMFFDKFKNVGLRRESLAIVYGMAEVVNTVLAIGGTGNEPIVVDCIDRKIFQEELRAVPVAADSTNVQRMLSTGRALPGTEFRLVDDQFRDVPERTIGEVVFKSDARMHGYHGNQDATKTAFNGDWYITGDMGYRVGDLLYVTGRKKDLIILGGNNIYPQDVEELIATHPAVVAGRVAALGIVDEKLGTQKLIIICETRGDDAETKRDVMRFIRREVQSRLDAHVDRVYLAPQRWLIKTSSGKIARKPNLARLHELENQPAV
ncbi:MAG: AMP-binding protein [Planctomycetes bacterium]|nr:AMP-binding protein [Planctomycetota bacterium]